MQTARELLLTACLPVNVIVAYVGYRIPVPVTVNRNGWRRQNKQTRNNI